MFLIEVYEKFVQAHMLFDFEIWSSGLQLGSAVHASNIKRYQSYCSSLVGLSVQLLAHLTVRLTTVQLMASFPYKTRPVPKKTETVIVMNLMLAAFFTVSSHWFYLVLYADIQCGWEATVPLLNIPCSESHCTSHWSVCALPWLKHNLMYYHVLCDTCQSIWGVMLMNCSTTVCSLSLLQ
jgi:hypothetical protein